MAIVWVQSDGVSCKYCGAVFAHPHDNDFGMCLNCFFICRHHNADDTVTHIDSVQFMARALRLELMHVQRGGLPGRCECLSKKGNDLWYQCGSRPVTMRDGRPVCKTHEKLPKVIWAENHAPDKYQQLGEKLSALAAMDPGFLKCMRDVSARVEGINAQCAV